MLQVNQKSNQSAWRTGVVTLASIFLGTALLAPADAWAMRCKNKIVSKGDPQAKVLQYCGEPVTRDRRYIERGGYYSWRRVAGTGDYVYRDKYYKRHYPYSYLRSEVTVDDWVYNFGPNKLMRRVIFENGIVKKVETLGRGYRE